METHRRLFWGSYLQVEHKDPPADPPSENEDMATALALEVEHVSADAEEDHVPLRRRETHGYEIDDFVVSEGSCEEVSNVTEATIFRRQRGGGKVTSCYFIFIYCIEVACLFIGLLMAFTGG